MSAVPRVAAEWMVSRLPSRRGQDHVLEYLETRGLEILSVKELKQLAEILYSMDAVVEEASIRERRLPSSAKKQRRIEFLRRGLFRDDSCKVVNDRLVQQMRSETRTPSSTTAAATVAASRLVATSKRPNNQISQQNQPRQQQQQQQQQQQNRITADDMSAFFNAYHMSMAHQHRLPVHGQHLLPNHVPMAAPQHMFEAPNRNMFDAPDAGTSAAAGSSSDPATDPHSTPQSPTESILLQQLLQMGFQKQEILDGIRQCQSTNSATPSADDVMLHLISQREEAEEARKEDEVRLLSEDQKQEESRRREGNQRESLSRATTDEDLRAIFPESWVLTIMLAKPNTSTDSKSVSTILGSGSKDDFLEFLKLEEKSRKWYGWILPSEYFRKVGKRLKGVGDKKQAFSWMTYLSSEREKLRCGLYELKEQLKGQPKIFLDERRSEESGGAAEVVIIDDD